MLKSFLQKLGFVVVCNFSFDELWWVDIPDGSRQYQMFSVSVTERVFEEGRYKMLQIVALPMNLAISHESFFTAKESA